MRRDSSPSGLVPCLLLLGMFAAPQSSASCPEAFAIDQISATSSSMELQIWHNCSVVPKNNGISVYRLWRDDNVLVREWEYNPVRSPWTYTDDGGSIFGKRDGLEPGASYKYSLHLDSGSSVSESYFCLVPANPFYVTSYAEGDQLVVSVVPDPLYPEHSSDFKVEITGLSLIYINAPDTTALINVGAYMTEYSVTVKSVRGACSGFALELLSDPYVITAYTGLETPLVDVTGLNRSCIEYNVTAQHVSNSKVVYQLFRNDIIIDDQLTTNELINADCSLTPGTAYDYKVTAFSTPNDYWVTSDPASECTHPSSATDLTALNSTNDSVSLSWVPGRGGVHLYFVSDDVGNTNFTYRSDGNLSHTLTSLSTATNYTVTVQSAFNCSAVGELKADSMSPSITLFTRPRPPIITLNNLPLSGVPTANYMEVEIALDNADSSSAGSITFDLFRNDELIQSGLSYALDAGVFKYSFTDDVPLATEFTYKAVNYYNSYASDPGFAYECSRSGPVENILVTHFFHYHVNISWSNPVNSGDPVVKYSQLVRNPTDENDRSENITTSIYSSAVLSSLPVPTNTSQYVSIRPFTQCAITGGDFLEGVAAETTFVMPPWPPTLSCGPQSSTANSILIQRNVSNNATVSVQTLLWRDDGFLSDTPVDNITEDTGLIPGRQYTYKAVLIQYGLQSDMSSECLTCPNPEEPVNLMAMPLDHESITVYFDAPEGNFDGFDFFDGTNTDTQADNTLRSYTFTGLAAETSYTLSVKTYVGCTVTALGGAVSLYSNGTESVTAYTAPDQVNITLTPLSASAIQIVFEHSPSAYKYHVWRDGIKIVDGVSSHNITDDQGLQAGTMYNYSAAVEKNNVLSVHSHWQVAFTNPDPVTNVELIDATTTTLVLKWIPPIDNVDGYLLTVDGTANQTEADASDVHEFTVTVATADTDYSISIYSIINNANAYGVQVSDANTGTYRTSMEAPTIAITEGSHANSLNISFTDSKSDSDLNERVLYRMSSSGELNVIREVSYTYEDSDLQFATTYTYYATNFGLNGFETDASAIVTYCTDPDEPPMLHLSAFDATANTYEVAWHNPQMPPTYYDVYALDENLGTVLTVLNVLGLSQDITALLPVSAETYKVGVTSVYTCAAANYDGSSASATDLMSDSNSTLTVYTAPGQPTLTLTTLSSSAIQIDATLNGGDRDTADVTIDVYRKLGTTEQGRVLTNQSHSSLINDNHELVPGTLYTYYIQGVYHQMGGVFSAEASQCTNPADPLQVRIYTSEENLVTIRWNAPLGGITDYELSINGSAPVNMASLMGSAGVTEAVTAATLTSDTSYKFEVRTTFLCTEGSVTKTSNYVEALTYTRPEKPVITSALPTSTSTIQVNMTTSDSLEGLTFTVFSKGVQVGTVSGGDTHFDHSGLRGGSEEVYTVTATVGEYTSLLSDPVIGCSFPNRPTNIYFTPVDDSSVQFRWTYPSNEAPDSGNVFYDITVNGSLDQDNYDGFSYTKTGLGPLESFNYTIETVLVCDADGSATEYDSTFLGLPDMYWGYTKPSVPVLALDGVSTVSTIAVTLDNPGSNAWSPSYDKIRLFRDGFEVHVTTDSTDPYNHTDTNLTAATEYFYDVEVTWNRLTAFSDTPLYECTYPEVVQNLRTTTHYWYGINVRWNAPMGNRVTGFEIKINVTGEDEWQDVGYEFQYSFRNSETPSDFEIENTGGQLAAFFNSKVTAGVKTLNPNTVYVIEVRAYYYCAGTTSTYNGNGVTETGITAPYPPQGVALTPVDENSISIAWTVVTSPEVLTYDIYECDSNYTRCNVIAEDQTTSPYVSSGLTQASFYCYDIRAKWNGLETSVRDRREWLLDYEDYVDQTRQHTEDNAYFGESQLTFTNFTHAYFDALCSCSYPPAALSIDWQQLNSSGIHYSWTVTDLSEQRRQRASLTGQSLIVYAVAYYDNVPATEEELDYDIVEHVFNGFNSIESHDLYVLSRLVCPDRRFHLADADTTVLDSAPLIITGWTRPTIPTFTVITQSPGNPDEEIDITYSTPDVEPTLEFFVERDFQVMLTESSATTQNDLTRTPGTAYNYTVYAEANPTPGVVLQSLVSEATEGCTLPMDITSLNKTDVVNVNSVKLNWDEPPGDFWLGYNYTLDGGTSFTFTTLQNQTLTGLDWCTQWTFEIYSLGDCGLTNDDMLSENSQSLTHYLEPRIPVIMTTSDAVSDSAISVVWTDPNEAFSCPTNAEIQIYRDGVSVHNLTAPGSGSQTDSGLNEGTAYEYQISAKRGTDESEWSNVFVLCTNPSALTAADLTCEPANDTSLFSRLAWNSSATSFNFDIDITGDFTLSLSNVDKLDHRLGIFEPGDMKLINVVVTVLYECPKSSGIEVLSSQSNPTIPITCYTLPGQLTIRIESSSKNDISLSWEHEGGSDGYEIRVTPFITTNSGDGSEVITTTDNTFDFVALDGKSTYTFEITNSYQGYTSIVATLEYDSSNKRTLIGLPFAWGIVVILLIVIVALVLLVLLGFLVYLLVKKVIAAAGNSSNNTVQPDDIRRGSTPVVDWNINKTYDLRTEHINRETQQKFR